jgi:alpha-N-arabinofuranosidase
MTDWSNSDKLYRIASGASDDDYHWTEVMMRDIPLKMFDALGLHHYSVIDWSKKGSATGFTEKEYFITMQRSLLMEELVTKHSAIMDKYDPKKTKALAVDEWGGWYDVEPGTNGAFLYQQNTMRDAMIAGCNLNIFNNHCDRVKMANLAQIINVLQAVILTDEQKMVLTPTYHVMEMYNVHQGATMLPLSVLSNEYVLGDEKLKAVWASASKDKAGRTHISLVNIDAHKTQDVLIDVNGATYNDISGRILKSDKLQNYNSFEKPNTIVPVEFKEAKLTNNKLQVKLPPFSVVVLELK